MIKPVNFIYSFTNPDGRCNEFISREDFKAGRFKLHFDVDKYFELRKLDTIYPFIEVSLLVEYF